MQQANAARPGVPCPECHFRIPVTIPMLLSNATIFCNCCGLKLSVDHEKSKEGLEMLQDLHKAMENAKNVKKNPLGNNAF